MRQKCRANELNSDRYSISDRDYLTKDERLAYLKILEREVERNGKVEHKLITRLLLNGLRCCEVVGLNYYGPNALRYGPRPYVGIYRRDINYEKGFIRVVGKGKKERWVNIDKVTLELLRWYIVMKSIPENVPVFFNDQTGKWSVRQIRRFTHDYSKIALKEGAVSNPIHPHMFRHTWAVLALFDNVRIDSIQKQLGHRYIQTTTEIYLNVAPVHRGAEIEEKMEKW